MRRCGKIGTDGSSILRSRNVYVTMTTESYIIDTQLTRCLLLYAIAGCCLAIVAILINGILPFHECVWDESHADYVQYKITLKLEEPFQNSPYWVLWNKVKSRGRTNPRRTTGMHNVRQRTAGGELYGRWPGPRRMSTPQTGYGWLDDDDDDDALHTWQTFPCEHSGRFQSAERNARTSFVSQYPITVYSQVLSFQLSKLRRGVGVERRGWGWRERHMKQLSKLRTPAGYFQPRSSRIRAWCSSIMHRARHNWIHRMFWYQLNTNVDGFQTKQYVDIIDHLIHREAMTTSSIRNVGIFFQRRVFLVSHIGTSV